MFKRWLILSTFLLASAGCRVLAQENDRSQYNTLDPQNFLSSRKLSNHSHPREVALSLFEESTQESEGRKSEAISIEYLEDRTQIAAVVTVTIVGVADDSLASRRYRIEFQVNHGNWQLDWVGSQTKCQPGRGHQNWSRGRCN